MSIALKKTFSQQTGALKMVNITSHQENETTLLLHTHHNGENTNVGEDTEKLIQMILVLMENETATWEKDWHFS